MSSVRAFPVRSSDTAATRASLALHGMALNALFPPSRVPNDMLSLLSRLDRVRR